MSECIYQAEERDLSSIGRLPKQHVPGNPVQWLGVRLPAEVKATKSILSQADDAVAGVSTLFAARMNVAPASRSLLPFLRSPTPPIFLKRD